MKTGTVVAVLVALASLGVSLWAVLRPVPVQEPQTVTEVRYVGVETHTHPVVDQPVYIDSPYPSEPLQDTDPDSPTFGEIYR